MGGQVVNANQGNHIQTLTFTVDDVNNCVLDRVMCVLVQYLTFSIILSDLHMDGLP